MLFLQSLRISLKYSCVQKHKCSVTNIILNESITSIKSYTEVKVTRIKTCLGLNKILGTNTERYHGKSSLAKMPQMYTGITNGNHIILTSKIQSKSLFLNKVARYGHMDITVISFIPLKFRNIKSCTFTRFKTFSMLKASSRCFQKKKFNCYT